MASEVEKQEKLERAERLKLARKRAGISGPTGVYEASRGAVTVENYKAHESGRNGFSVSDGRRYAELFAVPLTWLYLGIGRIDDADLPGASMDLRRAFTRLADTPADVQQQVLNFIDFQLSQFPTPSPRPQDQRHGQYGLANARHGEAP